MHKYSGRTTACWADRGSAGRRDREGLFDNRAPTRRSGAWVGPVLDTPSRAELALGAARCDLSTPAGRAWFAIAGGGAGCQIRGLAAI